MFHLAVSIVPRVRGCHWHRFRRAIDPIRGGGPTFANGPRYSAIRPWPERSSLLLRCASSSDTVREIKYQILQLILPALWQTHPGLLDARPEFEPGILALLQCSALRRPAFPGLQTHEHDPERLQGHRCEMQHKRQRHFAFVLRRWLTWFYPQVCQNQALSGASIFCLPPSCRHPPPQIADVTYLGC